jgi:hypothetical protein
MWEYGTADGNQGAVERGTNIRGGKKGRRVVLVCVERAIKPRVLIAEASAAQATRRTEKLVIAQRQ